MSAQKAILGKLNTPSIGLFQFGGEVYWLGEFENGRAPISKKESFGIVDSKGAVICRPQYDKIFRYNQDVAIVCKNNKYGLISIDGKELIKPNFYFISTFFCGRAFAQKEKNGLWILIDNDGREIKDNNWSSVSSYINDFATCIDESGDLCIINKQGEKIYEAELQFSDRNFKNIFASNFWISAKTDFKNDNRSEPKFEQLSDKTLNAFYFKNGYCIISKEIQTGKLKYGLINERGGEVLPCVYDEIRPVFVSDWAFKMEEKWGVMDASFEIIIPDTIIDIYAANEVNVIIYKPTGYGLVNRKNEEVLEFKFDEIKYLIGDLFAVQVMNRQLIELVENGNNQLTGFTDYPKIRSWQIYDTGTNKIISEGYYNDVSMVNSKFGLAKNYKVADIEFNSSNESKTQSLPSLSMIQIEYDISIFTEEGFTEIRNKNFTSKKIYTSQINSILFSKNHFLYKYRDYYFLSDVNNQNVLLDRNGNEMISHDIEPDERKGLLVRKDSVTNMFGVDKANGEVLIESSYDYISISNTGLIFQCANRYGFMDLLGNVLIKPLYSEMTEIETGALRVRLNNEIIIINKKGKKI